MRKIGLVLAGLFLTCASYAQSDAIKAIGEEYDASVMFFYKNTLAMLGDIAQSEEIQELTKDIENVRVVTMDRRINRFDGDKLKELVAQVQGEGYEEFAKMREEGSDITVFGKGEGARLDGFVVVVADERQLMLMDLTGSVDMNLVAKFAKQMQAFN